MSPLKMYRVRNAHDQRQSVDSLETNLRMTLFYNANWNHRMILKLNDYQYSIMVPVWSCTLLVMHGYDICQWDCCCDDIVPDLI